MDSVSSTLTLLVDSPILNVDCAFPVPVAQVLFCGNSLLKSRIFNVFPGENFIGRDRSSHIFLPSLHLSRFHASLYFQSGFGFLSDCNSHNGTYRSNLRLAPQFRYELFNGTEFKLGDLLFIYRYPLSKGPICLPQEFREVKESGSSIPFSSDGNNFVNLNKDPLIIVSSSLDKYTSPKRSFEYSRGVSGVEPIVINTSTVSTSLMDICSSSPLFLGAQQSQAIKHPQIMHDCSKVSLGQIRENSEVIDVHGFVEIQDYGQKGTDNHEDNLLILETDQSIKTVDSQPKSSQKFYTLPKLFDQDIVQSYPKHSFESICNVHAHSCPDFDTSFISPPLHHSIDQILPSSTAIVDLIKPSNDHSNLIDQTDEVDILNRQSECSSLPDDFVNPHSPIQTTHNSVSLPYLSSMDDFLRMNSSVEPPLIIFTFIIADTYSKCVIDLGGALTDDVYKATHLITDKVRRTIKFLCCLTRGCEIVSINWLLKSKAAGKFLDTKPYIIDDKSSEKKFRFVLKDSCLSARSNKLFANHVFYLSPNILPHRKEVEKMIYCSGGNICNSLQDSKLPLIIISCLKDIPIISKFFGNSLPSNVHLFTCEFILTGILRQFADFQSFRLLDENFTSSTKFLTKKPRICN